MRILFVLLVVAVSLSVHASEKLPELKLEKVYENVYMHKSYQHVDEFGLVSSNGLVVISNRNAFIIDTPWSSEDTENLIRWIKKNGYNLVGSVSTHSHEDRTAGIKLLNSLSIPTYASKLTNELLKKGNKELARNTFGNSEFLLFDGNLEVLYSGGGHTIDNIVVWLPESKILFGGCLVRSLQATSLGYVGEAVIDEWSSSIEKVIAKFPNATVVVPGHGNLGDASLLEHTKNLAKLALNQSKQSTVNMLKN